ncbi:hypothetical protein GF336_04380 [Candidatus Woesearchaeota archaeon]|nr:hypothetical protein [Candidatus Woesearchaeota archaeon]
MVNLPNFKKKCPRCGKFKFIKHKLKLCLECWEKEHGKYSGEDRQMWKNQSE